MDNKQYTDFLSLLATLDHGQLRHLSTRLNQQLSSDSLNLAMDKRLKKINRCIHCDSSQLIRWGQSHGVQRFRCKSCKKTFNELSNTPFARTRKREALALYAQSMVDGISLRKAAKHCKITLSTSFRWRHKFLTMPEQHKASKFNGIVEVDEIFFRESFKGKRNITHRKPRQHGRLSREDKSLQIPVLMVLDRSEHQADFVLDHNTINEVHPCLRERIKEDSILCSDGSHLYPSFAEDEGLCHKIISTKNRARSIDNGVFHIQTLNNYAARLRAWISKFYGVGTAYLKNYLAWWRMVAFEELETPQNWLNEALSD